MQGTVSITKSVLFHNEFCWVPPQNEFLVTKIAPKFLKILWELGKGMEGGETGEPFVTQVTKTKQHAGRSLKLMEMTVLEVPVPR